MADSIGGSMMQLPPLVGALIDHAARWHGATEIVPRDPGTLTLLPGLLFYDEPIAEGSADHAWPLFDDAAPYDRVIFLAFPADPVHRRRATLSLSTLSPSSASAFDSA